LDAGIFFATTVDAFGFCRVGIYFCGGTLGTGIV